MKEQKTSDLYEKVELVKWVKNAGEGGKAEGLTFWQKCLDVMHGSCT